MCYTGKGITENTRDRGMTQYEKEINQRTVGGNYDSVCISEGGYGGQEILFILILWQWTRNIVGKELGTHFLIFLKN